MRGQSSTKEILTPGGHRIFAFVAEVTRIENWLSSGRILGFETKLDESLTKILRADARLRSDEKPIDLE